MMLGKLFKILVLCIPLSVYAETRTIATASVGGDPSKTSYIAWKLSRGLYFIPLLFLTTQILFGSVLQILYVSILTIICFLFLISAIEGHFFKKITTMNRITNVVIACVLYYCCTLSVF